jgi:hypothetical protein
VISEPAVSDKRSGSDKIRIPTFQCIRDHAGGYVFLVFKFINFLFDTFAVKFLRQLRDDGAIEDRLFICPGFTGPHLHLSSRFVTSR